MFGRAISTILAFFIAFAILAVSLFRSASVKLVFSQSPSPSPAPEMEEVIYEFAYPGRILPDSPFWTAKVIRDKMWLSLTTNPLKRAEKLLLFADKRLASSKILFERKKPELAVSTLSKAEKYLEQAVKQERIAAERGMDTGEFLDKLAIASLKHRQVIEEEFSIAPEDAKPVMTETLNYPKQMFEEVKVTLGQEGRDLPVSPFEE